MNPYRDSHPIMLESKAAYRLAMKVAAKGGNVVFKCRSTDSLNDAREEMIRTVRWRGWFSYFLMDDWKVNSLWIRNSSGGRIDFMRYDSFDIKGRRVDLEIRA
jgi:hypothetical protein